MYKTKPVKSIIFLLAVNLALVFIASIPPHELISRCRAVLDMNMKSQSSRNTVLKLIDEIKKQQTLYLKSSLYPEIRQYYEKLNAHLGEYFLNENDFKQALPYYLEADNYSGQGYRQMISLCKEKLKQAEKPKLSNIEKRSTESISKSPLKPEIELNKLRKPKDNPFASFINNKARRIYKNREGYWEAVFDYEIIMIYIPAGEFNMGLRDNEIEMIIRELGKEQYEKYFSPEKPAHKVFLKGFWIGKYEVTVGQFTAFVRETGYQTDAEKKNGALIWSWDTKKWEAKTDANWKNPYFPQAQDHPVVCVSWNDAQNYVRWLFKKTGLSFQLPTEAQWEKAARGSYDRIYPWGNSEPKRDLENFNKPKPASVQNLNWKKSTDLYTEAVGSFPGGASPYGVLDIAGNVKEWCRDWYSSTYYSTSPQINPAGPYKGENRVLRGGSWYCEKWCLRCSHRNPHSPTCRHSHIGFRLAMIE